MRWVAGVAVAAAVLFAAITLLKRGGADAGGSADTTRLSTAERERVRDFWAAYRRATDLRIAGRTEEAVDAYRLALTLNPEHQDALYYLGSLEFDLGDLQGAERAWRRLVEVDPSNARGHSQLGMLYSCVGAPSFLDLASAASEFRRTLEINREETGPLLHLGEIALMQGDLATARAYFDSVIGSNYTSVEAHFYQGYVAWKTGATGRALELLGVAARHARPAEPAGGVAGEGDTRGGKGSMVTIPATCRPLRARMDELRGLADGDVPRRADAIYREADRLLTEARRVTPR